MYKYKPINSSDNIWQNYEKSVIERYEKTDQNSQNCQKHSKKQTWDSQTDGPTDRHDHI